MVKPEDRLPDGVDTVEEYRELPPTVKGDIEVDATRIPKKYARPPRHELEQIIEEGDERTGIYVVAEHYDVGDSVAGRWLCHYGLYEPVRDEDGNATEAGTCSDMGKRLIEMDPDEFSREYVPERLRRDQGEEVTRQTNEVFAEGD
jgi:hypothetical protein